MNDDTAPASAQPDNGDMVPAPAFSNGSTFDHWQANYCDQCWNDRGWRTTPEKPDMFCDIVAQGLAHIDVPQWVRSDTAPYGVHCTAFRPDDGGPDEFIPRPRPVPAGQELLFDPDPYNSFPDILKAGVR